MNKTLPIILCGLLAACDAPQHTAPSPLPPVEEIGNLSILTKAQGRSGTTAATQVLRTLRQTLSQDPATLSARLQVQQSMNAAQRSENWFRPAVSIDATQLVGSDFGANLRVTQPLYDFGKRASQRNVQLVEAQLRVVDLKSVQQSLSQQMLQAAVAVQEATALSQLNQRRIDAFQDALQRAERLSSLNLVTASDLRLTEVRLSSARKDYEASQIAKSQSQRRWRQLASGNTGIPTGALFPDLTRRFGLSSLNASTALAQQHNLSLIEAQANTNVALQNLGNVSTTRLPTINAVSTTRLASGSGKRTNLGLMLDFPLYSQDQSDAQQQAQETVSIEEAKLVQVTRDLEFTVANTWGEISDLKRLAALERDSIQGLRDRYETMLQQISTGLTSFDKVIEAQTELFDTEAAAIGNRFAADRAAINLLTITGVIVAD